MMKGVNKKIDECVLQWFGHVMRMENNRIAKRVYVGVCAGSTSILISRSSGLILKEKKRARCQARKENGA